jgi:hypothetical protein
MAQFALLFDVWMQMSRETLEYKQSPPVGALDARSPFASPATA